MDELLAGQWLSARVYPRCDHPPEDFLDEKTVIEQVKATKLWHLRRFVTEGSCEVVGSSGDGEASRLECKAT
jgi:hypothetical protein